MSRLNKKILNGNFKSENKENRSNSPNWWKTRKNSKKYQMSVWQEIVGSKRKDLLGVLNVENFIVLKMLPGP